MSSGLATVEFHEKECKNCGRTMQPELPPTSHLMQNDCKIGIRCAECRQINECEKKSTRE